MRPCASLFKVSPDSPPAGERRRVVSPRADQARRIVEVTEGRVDFSGIFAEARAVGAGQKVA